MSVINTIVQHSYNQLHSISEAGDKLNSKDKRVIVNPLLQIILNHKLEESVGIRLLHRHNDISADEIMAEDYQIDDGQISLVTRAIASAGKESIYAPNSWRYLDGHFLPVEFSNKILLNDPEVSPDTRVELFRELASVIEEAGVSDLVGPSLLGSKFIEEHRPAGSTMMIELTGSDKRENILRFVEPRGQIDGTYVETHWCAVGETVGDNGVRIAMMACKSFCPYIRPGVHQGTSQHDFNAEVPADE